MTHGNDDDVRLGQIALRMGFVAPTELPQLLNEARRLQQAPAQRAAALGQLMLQRKLMTVSDYLYMAQQVRAEAEAPGAPEVLPLGVAFGQFQSGELDLDSFEEMLGRSSDAPLARPPDVVQQFGPYEMHGELGRGGMGIVYRARDTRDGQEIALKVMIQVDGDDVRLARFEREAELAAILDHPNIVGVRDAGRIEGMPYFTMDLVDGESLDDMIEAGTLDRDVGLRALVQVARAMDHAHQRGIIHRDLKPGNVIVERASGRARVTDFGLARDLQRGTRLTLMGQAVGTPYYMSPEQVRGERDVDGRCDIYALGVILYEVLTGDVPFDADTPLSLFKKIDREEVVLPLDPAAGIDERIHKITLRALEKDRDQRYRTGALMADDLERYLRGEQPLALPGDRRSALVHKLTGTRAGRLLLSLAIVLAIVLGLALGLALDWVRDQRRAAAGAEAVEHALAAARAELTQAEHALNGNSRAALDRAEVGLAVLEDLGTLLLADDRSGAAARAAHTAGDGDALRASLEVLHARAVLAGDGGALPDAALGQARAVAADHPDQAALQLELTRVLRERGEAGAALDAVERVLEREPEHVAALVARARLRLELGLLRQAADDLSTALLREPDQVEALLLRAQTFVALGHLEAAARDARSARELDPTHLGAYLVEGDVAAARGELDEALSRYEDAARLAPTDPAPHLRSGALEARRGSYERALEAFERAQTLGAEREAREGRANALARLFQLDAAATALQEALDGAGEADPEVRAALLTSLGEVRLARGLDADARAEFDRAAALTPRATLARVWQARMALAAGDLAAARAAVPEPGSDPATQAVRARIALREGDLAAAEQLAAGARSASGRGAGGRAERTLARARLAAGSSAEARAACDAAWAAEVQGPDLAAAYLRQARELLPLAPESIAARRRAERLTLAALRLDPDRLRARLLLGRLLLQNGQLALAAEELERVAQGDPARPQLADALFALSERAGEPAHYERALAVARQVSAAHGATPDRLMQQARCLAELGRWEQALEQVDRVVETDPLRVEAHALRADALAALGRAGEADLARRRVTVLGPERGAHRDELFARAKAAEESDPRRALDLAREALRLADREARGAGLVARFAASLRTEPLERLEVLASSLEGLRWESLDRADALLADAWREPLDPAARRDLRLRAKGAGDEGPLLLALGGLYDALAGSTDRRWLGSAREAAQEAVERLPESLPARVARAVLRTRTGDPGRALRELNDLAEIASSSALYRFARAEAAAAATGDRAEAEREVARLRERLPRARDRLAASPALNWIAQGH